MTRAISPAARIERAGFLLILGLCLILGPWIHLALALGILYGLARTLWHTARRFQPVPPSLLAVIVVAGILNTGPDLLQASLSLGLCLAYAWFMPKDPSPCRARA